MTDVGKAIVNSLETDNEWRQTSCTIDNSVIHVSLWTANIPIIDTCVYHPRNVSLSWHDKWCIYFAIKKRNQTNLINSLNQSR